MRVPGDHDLRFPPNQGVMPRGTTSTAVPVKSAVGIVLRALIRPAERDVTKDDAIRGPGQILPSEGALQPRLLLRTQGVKGHPAAEAGVRVGFVFSGVKADHGHGSGAERPERTRFWSGDQVGHAERPHAAHVMVAPENEQGAFAGDVAPARMEQGGDQEFLLEPVIAGVPVPMMAA